MPWGMVAVAGIGLASSFLGKKSADKSFDTQKAMHDEEMKLAREELDFGKDKYSDWQQKFDPAFARMLTELDQDLTPNYGQIAGDVKSSFQSARGQEERSMQRYGIRPVDGAYFDQQRKYGINEAAAHVGARSQARESKRGLKYERLQNVSNMLVGMQGVPANMVSRGFQSGQTAARGAADTAGRQGRFDYNAGMNDAYGFGQAVGGIDWGGIWGDVKGWFGNRNAGSGGGAANAGASRAGA